MRVPFPAALRIGIDIIATNRILCPLKPDGKRLGKLTARFLHAKELDDLSRRYPLWTQLESLDESNRRQIACWIAGRWAAKEAAKKAWDATLLGFRDLRVETEIGGSVNIICDTNPDPNTSFRGKFTEQIARLSISHDGDYTIATVLATPLHKDISTILKLRKTEAEARLAGSNQ
ncbi:hypothetical protein PV08_00483 [Exophiala spinifera]|uniref:4'-phosphopantetheinyl transferase domain-containing protein n=1 Tax=Exophiala spinifera TaxID=91928 RepID=A0A0D2BLT3_9EURO|nr:uncharacterized protein PV08_00483 [Exophiala spinifera]KIW19908.1 hypothetical protein PV08_00483 [Exophiala spinifera]